MFAGLLVRICCEGCVVGCVRISNVSEEHHPHQRPFQPLMGLWAAYEGDADDEDLDEDEAPECGGGSPPWMPAFQCKGSSGQAEKDGYGEDPNGRGVPFPAQSGRRNTTAIARSISTQVATGRVARGSWWPA